MIAYALIPCGAVQGRSGRCRHRATKHWTVPRVSRRRGVIDFHVNRCDQHPPRNGTSCDVIEYDLTPVATAVTVGAPSIGGTK